MPFAVIVGAGPAGATLAYLLARRGVAVTLLERQTSPYRDGLATLIDDQTDRQV